MTSKEMISILEDIPEDIQLESVDETEEGGRRVYAKTLKDFRRLVLLYSAEVQIKGFVFWFQTEDTSLRFVWIGAVSGYTVQWCEQDGELRKNYFQSLENARDLADELMEKYDGVLLLPGTEQD